MIIEWNAHMFSRDTTRYPFHPRAAYIPDSADWADDPLSDYLAHMAAVGIDKAVLVHPEPYGDDHRLVLDCLQREPTRLLATSLFYPRDTDAPQKLTELVRQQPKIIATRFHAHRSTRAYLDSFTEPGVCALWETAAALGLIVELHIGPNYAREVVDLIRTHPTCPVLIDHLGEPIMGNPVEFADVLALARFENVYMKLSGLSYFSQAAPLYLDAKPFTRWVVDAFGPERLVWGGDTPQVVDAHLDHLSEAEREKVKGGNLAQLLPFGRG